MRVAPPVQALSCSAGPWRSIQQALYALAAAVAAYWAGAQLWGAGPWVALAAVALGLAAAAWAGRALAAPAQQLVWDGAVWQLRPAGSEPLSGQALLMLDLGGWMLVRFAPAGAGPWRDGRWLPLSHRDAGAAWQALRVALHAPPRGQPAA